MVHHYKGGKSVTEVAEYFGVSVDTVRAALRASDVSARTPGTSNAPDVQLRNRAIVASYQRGGTTMQQLAEGYGITRERVRQILNDAGLDNGRRRATRSRLRAAARTEADTARSEEVLAAYRENPNVVAIAKRLSMSREAVDRIVRALPETDRLAIRREHMGRSGQRARHTEEQLLAGLREHAEGLPEGALVTLVTWNPWAREHGYPSSQIYMRRFGSWTEALARAGVPHGRSGGPGPTFTDDELLQSLVRVTKRLRRPPSIVEYETARRDGEPSAITIRNRLGRGRWLDALGRIPA